MALPTSFQLGLLMLAYEGSSNCTKRKMGANPYCLSARRDICHQVRSCSYLRNQGRLRDLCSALSHQAAYSKGPTLGLMLCSQCFEILSNFWTKSLAFLFFSGSFKLWIWSWLDLNSADESSCLSVPWERKFLDLTHLDTWLLVCWAWRWLNCAELLSLIVGDPPVSDSVPVTWNVLFTWESFLDRKKGRKGNMTSQTRVQLCQVL